MAHLYSVLGQRERSTRRRHFKVAIGVPIMSMENGVILKAAIRMIASSVERIGVVHAAHDYRRSHLVAAIDSLNRALLSLQAAAAEE